MKQTYSILFFSFSVILFVGVFKYTSKQHFLSSRDLFLLFKNTQGVNERLKSSNKQLMMYFEYEEYHGRSDFEELFQQMRAIEKAGNYFKTNLEELQFDLQQIENPFYANEGNIYQEFEQPSIIIPCSNEKEIKAITQKIAPQLQSSYALFIKKITIALNDTSLFNSINREILQALQNENKMALDNFKRDIKAFESIEVTEKDLTQFEHLPFSFLQLQLLSETLVQRYYLFQNEVINNFKKAKQNIKNKEIGNQNFTLVLYEVAPPVIGEDYQLGVVPFNYIINETLEMRVNGQPIPVKNGIGYYTNKNKKPFYVTTSLINPMTGKRDNYNERFK